MARRTVIANGQKSRLRSHGEHVFAERTSRMSLVIRAIGIARATMNIGVANIVYNVKRLVYLEKAAIAQQYRAQRRADKGNPPPATPKRAINSQDAKMASNRYFENTLIEPSSLSRKFYLKPPCFLGGLPTYLIHYFPMQEGDIRVAARGRMVSVTL